MGVHRTCGEPDEIELTPMGVELYGPGTPPTRSAPVAEASTKSRNIVTSSGWVFFLTSFGSAHVLRARMGRTCGEPTNEIGLTIAHGLFTAPMQARARTGGRTVSPTGNHHAPLRTITHH